MKKTMFITSVIMVVVMAIALTTSSLAWFTAAGSNDVTTSSLTLQAKTNSSTGLLLGNSASSFSTTSVVPTATTASKAVGSGNTIAELQPVGLYNSYEDESGGAISTSASVLESLVREQFTGRYVTSAAGATAWANNASYTDHFAGFVYVANSGNAATYVSAAINFSEVKGATLYVAVLANKTQDSTIAVADIAAYETSDFATNWEILNISASNNSSAANIVPTSLPIAKRAALYDDFDTEQNTHTYNQFNPGTTVASTFENVNFTARTSNKSSVALGYAADNAAYSHYQQFMVLAWYSADLVSNNSGATKTTGSFTVTFTANAS